MDNFKYQTAAQYNIAEQAEYEEKQRKLVFACYILNACSLLVGLTLIISVVIAHVKKDDVAGTWLESHYKWLITTFWYWLLFFVIGLATLITGFGFIILFAGGIWWLYRNIKGFLAFWDNKPVNEKNYTPNLR